MKLIYDDQTCLKVSEAARPNDISWFNLASESKDEAKTKIQAIGLVVLLSLIFLGILSLIQMWRVKTGLSIIQFSSSNKKLMQKTSQGVWFFFVTCLITKILQVILGAAISNYFSRSNPKTKTGEMITNIIFKTPAYFFFLLLAISIFSDFLSPSTVSWNNVAVILNLFVGQCLMMRTMPNIIHFDLITQAIKLKCFYSGETSPVYQIELNRLFKKP